VAALASLVTFFESRPSQPLPEPAPPRSWPPENVIPGVVALEAMLGRSDTAAVAVGRPRCFPEGFALTLLVRLVESARSHDVRLPDGRIRMDTTHFPSSSNWGFRPSWARDEGLPDDLLRVGIVFADGRAVTNLDTAGVGTGGDIRLSILGGGGMRSWDYQFWVQPLPPFGALSLLCEWPAKSISEARVEIDAAIILQAASGAVGRPTFAS
jgi:hypothetical protein